MGWRTRTDSTSRSRQALCSAERPSSSGPPSRPTGSAARWASPRSPGTGAELIQAQLLAQTLVVGVKQVTRRSRPSGTGFSFPSGHATSAFASATVLQRRFGWKVGTPAYAVAAYVAASRVQNRKHYLSDVAFGAALGVIAGRTVTVSRHRELVISPMMTDGGGGLLVTWNRR